MGAPGAGGVRRAALRAVELRGAGQPRRQLRWHTQRRSPEGARRFRRDVEEHRARRERLRIHRKERRHERVGGGRLPFRRRRIRQVEVQAGSRQQHDSPDRLRREGQRKHLLLADVLRQLERPGQRLLRRQEKRHGRFQGRLFDRPRLAVKRQRDVRSAGDVSQRGARRRRAQADRRGGRFVRDGLEGGRHHGDEQRRQPVVVDRQRGEQRRLRRGRPRQALPRGHGQGRARVQQGAVERGTRREPRDRRSALLQRHPRDERRCRDGCRRAGGQRGFRRVCLRRRGLHLHRA